MSLRQYANVPVEKIIGIQAGIMSPDEIRKGSVVHVTSKETYPNNKPALHGIFDPRMGVLDPGLICPTDGLDYINTPGYHGHIELALPVYYAHMIPYLMKVHRCVCFNCSKLLIDIQDNIHLLELPSDARAKRVFELCKHVKYCGSETSNGCGYLQPKYTHPTFSTIQATWTIKKSTGELTENKLDLTATMSLQIMKRISDEHVHFMGYSPIYSRPDWWICQVLYVSPPSIRPSVKHDASQRSEDDLSHGLMMTLKYNQELMRKIKEGADENTLKQEIMLLTYYVSCPIKNKYPGVPPAAHRSGRELKSIYERLGSKTGRFRGNLMAKRVDFSARSVITADPNLSIEELGVPLKVSKVLTFPTKVNDRNKEFLTVCIRNGPDKWPGARILEKENGEKITLRYFTDRDSIELSVGDIVHRHMINGDPLIFNRQPSLHRMSKMGHKARIMPSADTFRMNVADTAPYNADFDKLSVENRRR